jgi:glycosyltransferase involved in cell wall biosynthesis
MNLLFALPGFHRFDRGAEVALLAVATELARGGDRVTVVGSGAPRADIPYEYRRIRSISRERFERAPKIPLLRNETAWEDATFAFGLARVPLARFDATITCSFPFTHWALRRGGKAAPAHIFVTQNGDWPAYSDSSEYRLFNCDGLVCTNPDYWARNKDRWHCSLIPNGIELERFKPGDGARDLFGLPQDAPLVLMVSALIDSKRVIDGIRIVSGLERTHLVVAGDGPLRQQARELAEELLPGRYTQLTLPASEMPALYRCADAFMHLSLTESFGNVYLEAWASGLPIIAHDSQRLRWILDRGQFLCDTNSLDQARAALAMALARGKSATARGIGRFAWPAIAALYREALLQAVDRRQFECRRK